MSNDKSNEKQTPAKPAPATDKPAGEKELSDKDLEQVSGGMGGTVKRSDKV